MVRRKKQIPIADILEGIRQADHAQVGEICAAVMQRYKALFPDCEIMFLNLPKYDIAERERLLRQIASWLEAEIHESVTSPSE